ncbi:MAG: hypothetical protein ACRDI3_07385 [Actinomycetota bacterium]
MREPDMGSGASSVVEDALGEVRLALGREIVLQKPPLVPGYEIAPKLIRDAIREAARAVPQGAFDPVTLTISNVEVELEEDEEPSSIRAGKHLGLTFRWPSTGVEPQVSPALEALMSETGSYAYAVDREGEASITILLRDLGQDVH